jgi:hypothetical protein
MAKLSFGIQGRTSKDFTVYEKEAAAKAAADAITSIDPI